MRACTGSVFLRVVGVFVLERESERHTGKEWAPKRSGSVLQKSAVKPNNERPFDGAEGPFFKEAY